MSVHFSSGAARSLFLLAAVASVFPPLGFARSPSKPEPVGMFAALDAGDVEVSVVPRDASRLTMQIKNKTDRPLSIEVPRAFAAVPVLAQFAPFPQANQQNNNAQASQQLGVANNNNQNAQGPFNNPGIFNVPAGKVIKLKLPCVCLEYGKPTPDSRMPYAVTPLESVVDRPEIGAALESLARGDASRSVVQVAAWHYANGKSWKELADMRVSHIGSFDEPRFSADEISKAKTLVAKLAQAQSKPKAAVSLSQQ